MNKEILKHLGLVGFDALSRSTLAWCAEYQREVLRVMSVLPGKYRYSQVEAAINAADVSPRDIYKSLAANRRTFSLVQFYDALGEPEKAWELEEEDPLMMGYDDQLAWLAAQGKGKVTIEEIEVTITQGALVTTLPKSQILEAMIRATRVFEREKATQEVNQRLSAKLDSVRTMKEGQAE